jgi:hypothetical protein
MAPAALSRSSTAGAKPGVTGLRRMWYRVEQFGASISPKLPPQELERMTLWLPPGGVALFQRMTPRDQRHSLDVAERLCAAGHDCPDLLAAALLHDAAKTALPGRRLKLGHRVAVVLVQAIRPGWVEHVARDVVDDWRYPFYLHLHHPELGARLAEEAGCSPLTVRLIRRHQVKLAAAPADEEDQWLVWLQEADDAS